MGILSFLAAAFALTPIAQALTSGLVAVDAFASVSSDVAMYVYIPTTKTNSPAIVVAIHSCERTAGYYFENTGYAALADTYGYMVIFPNSSGIEDCWDTSSTQSTTPNGGGQSQAVADMVTYATKNYNADGSRVFVTGSSSGGIMVNLLAGIYPSIFKAASVFSGLYAGSVIPYSGIRPKMLIWHGTSDIKYPYVPSFTDELSGWSGVLDVTLTNNVSNTPSGGYTKMIYGDGSKLVGISALGVGHTVPVDAASDLGWFCIFPTCALPGQAAISTTSSSSSTTSSSSSSATSTTTSTSSSSSSTVTSSTTSVTSSTVATTSGNTALQETSTSSASASAAGHSGLSSGAKVGVSVSAVGGVLLLVAAAAALTFRRQRQKQTPQSPEPENAMVFTEPQGHEMHSGYGVVPRSDTANPGDHHAATELQGEHYSQNAQLASTTDLLAPGGEQLRPISEVTSLAYTHLGRDTPDMSEVLLGGENV